MEYVHRMRLPKYKKYKDYVFKFYDNVPSPKRDYFEMTLAVMMTNPLDNSTIFMVYKLDEP